VSRGPRPHSGHRRRRRRGSGRPQHSRAGPLTVTRWLWIEREQWNQRFVDGDELHCPEGFVVLVADVEGPLGRRMLPHPFPLDECAHCACEHLEHAVTLAREECSGIPPADQASSSIGIVAHGVTCGVIAARTRPTRSAEP
jgi:hypothetical protein